MKLTTTTTMARVMTTKIRLLSCLWILSFVTAALALSLSPATTTTASRRHVLQTTSSVVASSLIMPPPVTCQAATANKIAPTATLSDGTQFPLVSFGLQIYNDDTAYRLTLTALEAGYRNFFASVLAGNQKGFAEAILDSQIPRDQLYICGSVVSNRVQGFQQAKDATTAGWKRNLQAFSAGDLTYLNQIMLDYPGPDLASIQGQWASFQQMKQEGLVKSLSVSNFNRNQLDAILNWEGCTARPVVNQLPYSVAYHPGTVVKDNLQRQILVQAWAPLGGSLGGRFDRDKKKVCANIGKRYSKSWAQVALRWIVQTGASFTTQSQNPKHFADDLNIFDFALTPEEMEHLSQLAS